MRKYFFCFPAYFVSNWRNTRLYSEIWYSFRTPQSDLVSPLVLYVIPHRLEHIRAYYLCWHLFQYLLKLSLSLFIFLSLLLCLTSCLSIGIPFIQPSNEEQIEETSQALSQPIDTLLVVNSFFQLHQLLLLCHNITWIQRVSYQKGFKRTFTI